jgi:ketosteroid isomerase-like protein
VDASEVSRRVAYDYVDRLERRDWAGLSDLLADDVVYEIPQTRERIRGRDGLLRFNAEYPGDWHLVIRRIVADGPAAALWLDFQVDAPGQRQDACVWLDVSEHGRITRIVDYWPDPYDPPPGREHLVERY